MKSKVIATSLNKYSYTKLDIWYSSLKTNIQDCDFVVYLDSTISPKTTEYLIDRYPEIYFYGNQNTHPCSCLIDLLKGMDYKKAFWIRSDMQAKGSLSRLHSIMKDHILYVGENHNVYGATNETVVLFKWSNHLDAGLDVVLDEEDYTYIDSKWDSEYLSDDVRLYREQSYEVSEEPIQPKLKVAIIGNGPSYEIFEKTKEKYDLVVGCNVPPLDWNIFDFSVIADEKALIKAIREQKSWKYHKYVLGERAVKANDVAKFYAGGEEGLYDGLKKEGALKGTVETPKNFQDLYRRTGYFSSGHLAFKYVCEKYNPYQIDLYGFDSIFTDKQSTYSDFIMGAATTAEEALNPKNKRHISPPVWYHIWDYILHENPIVDKNTKVRFLTYEGDTPTVWDMFKENVSFVPYLNIRR